MKKFINFLISPHCFDSRILQGEMHIYQILHLSEETWAKKGQKRWRQLLPKVLLDHSYHLSLCDSPMPHHLAQSYQPLLFLGLVLCYLLSVIGKIRAISILLHLLFTRVTYIQITEVFMALPLKCFSLFSVLDVALWGKKKMLSYKMIRQQSLWSTLLFFGAYQHPSVQKPPWSLAVGMVRAGYCDFLLPLHTGHPWLLPFFSWWLTSSMRWGAVATRNWAIIQLHGC